MRTEQIYTGVTLPVPVSVSNNIGLLSQHDQSVKVFAPDGHLLVTLAPQETATFKVEQPKWWKLWAKARWTLATHSAAVSPSLDRALQDELDHPPAEIVGPELGGAE